MIDPAATAPDVAAAVVATTAAFAPWAGTAHGQRCRPRTGGRRMDHRHRPGQARRCRLRFGTVWVNDHIPLVSEMPHGGFKQSGYGNDRSMDAVEAYTGPKHVMVTW